MTGRNGTLNELSFPNLWQFRSLFPDESACLEFLVEKRRETRDLCGTGLECKLSVDRGASTLLRCRICRRRYSPRSATLAYNSNVPLLKWFELFWLFSAMPDGLTVSFVMRYLGISHVAAWRMLQSLRLHIDAQRRFIQLGGGDRAVVLRWTNLRVRTPRRRTLLVFALDDGKEIVSLTCPERRAKYIRQFLSERLVPNAQLSIPDRYDCKMAASRYRNTIVVRDSSEILAEEGRGPSFVTGLNDWVRRVYKHVRPDYAGLYVREREFRVASDNDSARMFVRLVESFPPIAI